MGLRVLALVAFLGLHSGMGALTGLLHLCRDEVRLRATCCCGHGKKAGQPAPQELGQAAELRCCDAPVVRPEQSTALAMFESRWELPAKALLPVRPVLPPPPEPESLPEAWVRTQSHHRSTAPPIYIQHCTYLI
ncbi:hypothetical protein JQX13_16275 [Archangium violaceum]|uniref:hypothetical protein n=1 Tax=Archangium violaceum TaxID=83451 RepID=UPI00193C6E37|nr:hypothetical protein [Archangium violaceum]QRK11488.1 hypothetical protein JQX13_16275 [Archangium violaceum]